VPSLDRRQLLRIFGAVAAAGATGSLVACSDDPSGAGDPMPTSGITLRIGLVVPSSGPLAVIGEEIKRGFQLHLADNGGLLGPHNVVLQVVDEGATAESALAAVNELIQQRVAAIVGITNPDALPAVAVAVQDAQIPLVSAHVAPGTLTNALFVWRVSSVVGDAGRSLAGYAMAEGGRSCVLHDGSSVGAGEAESFRRSFEDLGGEVVTEAVGTANLAASLEDAANQDANSIFACFAGADAIAMLDSYRQSGLRVKLLGSASLTETVDLASFTQLPANVYTSMFYAPDIDNEPNRRFVTTFHLAHGKQPSSYALAGYDGASVLAKAAALVRDAEPSGVAINTAFSRLGQIDSPRGTWTFNINRSPQQKWYLRRLHYDGMVPANLLDADLTVLG
jgi:branched-chain amino acid transport system substrate-binding protein